MKKKKFKLKVNLKSLRFLILLTLVFTMLGLSFGKLLDTFLAPSKEVPSAQVDASSETPPSTDESVSGTDGEASSDATEEINNKIYVMQLGVYETYNNVLSLAGQLKQLGYNYGILKVDGKYSIFSHISGTKESLAEVEETMKKSGIDCFVKEVEVAIDDLKWNYFLQAVKQKPYEMATDFIQTFTDDEMQIWGYYVTLSTASFEAMASERQKMLLEIYQWLTG